MEYKNVLEYTNKRTHHNIPFEKTNPNSKPKTLNTLTLLEKGMGNYKIN